jgi:hypothetical protein
MKTTLTTILTFLLFISCSSDDSKSACEGSLPAATTTGANTFGACINGNLLIPRDGTGTFGGSDNAVSIYGDPTGNQEYTEIEVRDYKSTRTAKLLLHIQNLNTNGINSYIINLSNGFSNIDGLNHTYIHCRVFDETTNSYQYYRSIENSGQLNIINYELIPYVKLIISGSFNCVLQNSTNSSDVIEIQNGRFDFNGATISNKVFP